MNYLRLIILFNTIISLVACSGDKTEKASDYPMFWTWPDYRPGMNFDSVCSVMNETGIDGDRLSRSPVTPTVQLFQLSSKESSTVSYLFSSGILLLQE